MKMYANNELELEVLFTKMPAGGLIIQEVWQR